MEKMTNFLFLNYRTFRFAEEVFVSRIKLEKFTGHLKGIEYFQIHFGDI